MSIEQHVYATARAGLPYLYAPALGHSTAAPLVVFLHGAKDRGNDLSKLLAWGFPKYVNDNAPLPYYWLALQIPEGTTWPEWQEELFALIDKIRAVHDIDRVVLSGFSLGSAGVWQIASRHPERFAAVVAVSGRVPEAVGESGLAALRRTPVWVFHGDADDKAPVAGAASAVSTLQALGAPAQLTLIPGGDHFIADEVYGSEELQAWLVSVRAGAAVATV
ncbi:alpha/beta fold hydrolase [Chitinolyticbacter albus]|uniref:carboxylesterase family protein n=1 Tax=Chitinolyticbacter albus TaxID=2961951 RepID=UPI00210AEEC2|nr:alpha/beta fold hydrolase [Chitinolyticbacter albus]